MKHFFRLLDTLIGFYVDIVLPLVVISVTVSICYVMYLNIKGKINGLAK